MTHPSRLTRFRSDRKSFQGKGKSRSDGNSPPCIVVRANLPETARFISIGAFASSHGNVWTLPTVEPVCQPSLSVPFSFVEVQELQSQPRNTTIKANELQSLRDIQTEEAELQAEAQFFCRLPLKAFWRGAGALGQPLWCSLSGLTDILSPVLTFSWYRLVIETRCVSVTIA